MSSPIIKYCGEEHLLKKGHPFTIGREADLSIDENPYLHRHFLTVSDTDGLWWIENVGSRIAATLSEGTRTMQAWLGPGARLPLVFQMLTVVFTAGPTTYELSIEIPEAGFANLGMRDTAKGQATLGEVTFTQSQFLLILALSEPWLRKVGPGSVEIPPSSKAAARLGWPLTQFNRKLDNVADKLDRMGVKGLRGGPSSRANNRRVRLVEYAVTSRLVQSEDLYLLDQEGERNGVAPVVGRPPVATP